MPGDEETKADIIRAAWDDYALFVFSGAITVTTATFFVFEAWEFVDKKVTIEFLFYSKTMILFCLGIKGVVKVFKCNNNGSHLDKKHDRFPGKFFIFFDGILFMAGFSLDFLGYMPKMPEALGYNFGMTLSMFLTTKSVDWWGFIGRFLPVPLKR